MGKGSKQRPKEITDEELEKAWNAVFAGHPSEGQFETIKKDIVKRKKDVIKEDDYGNELPYKIEPEKPKHNDPDRFVDDMGDS
tara:strand:- start:115 stop:363 length:249 start_codon:yes stop_codon:yes gene_type:complete